MLNLILISMIKYRQCFVSNFFKSLSIKRLLLALKLLILKGNFDGF